MLGRGCVLPVAINDYLCLIDIDLALVAIIVSPFVGLELNIIVECLSGLYGYGCLKLGFGFASKTRYFSYPAVMRVGGPDKANSFECCALRCIGFSVDGYAFFVGGNRVATGYGIVSHDGGVAVAGSGYVCCVGADAV